MPDHIYDDPKKILAPDDASKVVLERYQWSKRDVVNEAFLEKNRLYYREYRGYREAKASLVTSNFAVPLIREHIDSFIPRIIGNRPRIEVYPRGPEDEAVAAMLRALIFQFWQRENMPFFLANFVKYAFIYRAAIAKVYYSRKVGVREVQVQDAPVFDFLGQPLSPGGIRTEDQEILLRDGPKVDLLEIDDVFPDPRARSWEDAAWVIHRKPTSMREIEDMDLDEDGPVRELLKRMKEGANPLGTGQGNQEASVREDSLESFGSEARPTTDPFDRQVHLLEMTSDDKVITVVEEFPDIPPIVNAVNEMGMKPYVAFTPDFEPNELYGTSTVEKLYALALYKTAIRNARMDQILSTIHSMWRVSPGGPNALTANKLRFRPNGIVYADEGEIEPLAPPPLNFASYREEEVLNQEAERLTGAGSQTFFGQETRGAATATEVATLAQSAGNRVSSYFHILSSQSLIPMARRLIRIWELHPPSDAPFEVPQVGSEFRAPDGAALGPAEVRPGVIQVDPQAIQLSGGLDRDLIVDVGSTEPETKQFRAQRAMNVLSVIGQIPLESFANPMVARQAVAVLQASGDEFAHEVVEQVVNMARQQAAVAQQGGAAAAPPGAQTTGDQLAIDQSSVAPNVAARLG